MFEFEWTVLDNADFTEPLNFTQSDGTPVDFTGSSFRMDIKQTVDDASATASLTTANDGIESTDLANGKITLKLGTFDLQPGSYVADLIRINGGAREALAALQITVEKGVTGQ